MAYSPLIHFNRGVDKPLMYIVPLRMEYELALRFTRLSLVGLVGSISSSMYALISDIQEDCEIPYVIAITTFGFLMLCVPKVSCMMKWLIHKVLVLVSLDNIYSLVFFSFMMC